MAAAGALDRAQPVGQHQAYRVVRVRVSAGGEIVEERVVETCNEIARLVNRLLVDPVRRLADPLNQTRDAAATNNGP